MTAQESDTPMTPTRDTSSGLSEAQMKVLRMCAHRSPGMTFMQVNNIRISHQLAKLKLIITSVDGCGLRAVITPAGRRAIAEGE